MAARSRGYRSDGSHLAPQSILQYGGREGVVDGAELDADHRATDTQSAGRRSEALELRLRIRKVPRDYPRRIFEAPEQRFFDTAEETHIAIKTLEYYGKQRNMMIAYESKGDTVRIITIHPIRDEQIIRRRISGRWVER